MLIDPTRLAGALREAKEAREERATTWRPAPRRRPWAAPIMGAALGGLAIWITTIAEAIP